MGSFISLLPSWILFLLVFLIGILAAEFGGWFARKRDASEIKDKGNPIGSMLGALLGLLAFMLGLTFSITAARFSERKRLLVNQANAISTCYLRTDLIPEKQKRETQRLFSEYIDLLVTISSSPGTEKILKMEALQLGIWKQAASLKDENMDPPLKSLYLASVNSVIDLFEERKTVVFIFNVPSPVWIVLLLLFISSMFVAGLETNNFKLRRNLNVPIMTASFALIVVLISAMDASTRSGRFCR